MKEFELNIELNHDQSVAGFSLSVTDCRPKTSDVYISIIQRLIHISISNISIWYISIYQSNIYDIYQSLKNLHFKFQDFHIYMTKGLQLKKKSFLNIPKIQQEVNPPYLDITKERRKVVKKIKPSLDSLLGPHKRVNLVKFVYI